MERIVVTKRIIGNTISQEEAANLLGVCSRQVRRIVKRYKEEGKLEVKVPSKFSDNALNLTTSLGINMPQNAIIKSND